MPVRHWLRGYDWTHRRYQKSRLECICHLRLPIKLGYHSRNKL